MLAIQARRNLHKEDTSPSQFFRRAIEQCESLSCPGCALCCTPTRETTDEKNKFKRGSRSAQLDPASYELHEEDNYEWWEETMRMQDEDVGIEYEDESRQRLLRGRNPAGRRRRVCWPWGPARVCRPCPMCGQRCTGHPQNSYDNACTHALEGMNLHEWGS